MAEKLEKLRERYRAGVISRREFIQRASLLAGSVAAGASLIDSLLSQPAGAAQVDPADPTLTSSDVKYNSSDGASINAYLTRPRGTEKHPAILMIHDNGGLEDHNRDVARRFAKAGYVTIVPDLLSRQGGTDRFANREAVAQAISNSDNEAVMRDLAGAVNYLKAQNFVLSNRIGVVGFCWGGGKTFLFTTRSKDLAASVIYYGPIPNDLEDVKNITAPVLAHYGELDKPITSQVPRLEEAMKKWGKSYQYKIYADAPHAFNSDNRPERYRPEAAKEAWNRTLAFFKQHLQA